MKNKNLLWIYILSASIYFAQGIESLPCLSLFAYLKEKLHLDASTIMYIGSITTLAWIIKPIWGYICDQYLSKKIWINISLLGSLLVCLCLGLMPLIPLTLLVIMLSIGNLTTAFRDVGADGIMCIEGKQVNACGSIQSIQWISITIAGIFVGLVGGYIADHFNYKVGYLSLIPIYFIILWIVSKYRTVVPKNRTLNKEPCEETCVSYPDSCEGCQQVVNQKKNILSTILSYRELFIDKRFLIACLFIFLYNFNPSFGVPLQFIEKNNFGWSWTFMGCLGAITSILSIIGAIVYYKIGQKINIKKWLFYSVLIGASTTLCYLYFTPTSAIIYSIIFSTISLFIFLNVMTFMAKSTISGKEATSFALLCGVNNLAGSLSGIAGAYLFPIIGLKYLIIISAGTSFLCLPILNKLEIK